MKNLLSFTLILFLSFSVSAQDKPEFKFEKETIDYGKIIRGSDGKRIFEFTNVGKSPLIITKVEASCGCTVPKKPEQPIMPGKKGQIEVLYDTKKLGGFSKIITVYSNAKNAREILKIKGYVQKVNAPEKKKKVLFKDS